MSRCLLCCFDRSTKVIRRPEEEVILPNTASAQALDPISGMSDNDRKLIKDTCDVVFKQMNIQNRSVAFLIAFFKRYPHHQRYFKTFRDVPPDELTTIPLLENHGRRVMDQIVKLVQNMEDLDLVQEQLTWIAKKHKPRNVRTRQFKDMLTMFVDFVGEEMGELFTEQHRQAWSKWHTYILFGLKMEESKTTITNGTVNLGAVGDGSGSELGTSLSGMALSETVSSGAGTEPIKSEPDLLPTDTSNAALASVKTDMTPQSEISKDTLAEDAKENTNTNAIMESDRTVAVDVLSRNGPVSESVNDVAMKAAEDLTHTEMIVSSTGDSQAGNVSQDNRENGDLNGQSNALDCSDIKVDMMNVTCVGGSDAPNDPTANDKSISAVTVLSISPEDLSDRIHPGGVQGICEEAFPTMPTTEESDAKSQVANVTQDPRPCEDNVQEEVIAGVKSVSNTTQSTTNVEIHYTQSKSGVDNPAEVTILDTNKNCGYTSSPKEKDNCIVRA